MPRKRVRARPWLLGGEKILITGATGKIGFPIARALANRNEVWGAARLKASAARDKLAAAGITPVALDLAAGDLSSLPNDSPLSFTQRWTHRTVLAGEEPLL